MGITIDVEYGFSERAAEDGFFYARKIRYPILTSVIQGLTTANFDILPYRKEEYRSLMSLPRSSRSTDELMLDIDLPESEIQKDVAKDSTESKYCLLTFDLRNQWHYSITVNFEVSKSSTSKGQVFDRVASSVIQPNSTQR